LTVGVDNSATWLTIAVSLPVRGSGLEMFAATEPKATSSNVYAVPGVGPAELVAPIIDIRPSLSPAAQVVQVFENSRLVDNLTLSGGNIGL